jgi:putative CocE/NonD family hydrolase
MDKINMPILYFDGWLDPVALATKKNYLTMVGNGRKNQKLIWGPWDHFTNQESKSGVTDFGPDGYIDMRTTCLRWFDRWLKGIPNGIDKEPRVSDFVIGEGWRHESQWPPKGMRLQRWYLGAGGSLTKLASKKGSPSSYVYDPAKYVYSNDFSSGYFGQIGDDAGYLCKRKDQVLFDSLPLKKPLRLDGPISAVLYASTSAKDTDWVMALIDRHPDGICVPLATGFVRARYRDSLTHPSLLKQGEIVAYHLDLWQTGIVVPAGHRLRVAVCSTMFPDADRNLNTGEPTFNATRMVVARQKIYHDRAHPSFVELPVLGDRIG